MDTVLASPDRAGPCPVFESPKKQSGVCVWPVNIQSSKYSETRTSVEILFLSEDSIRHPCKLELQYHEVCVWPMLPGWRPSGGGVV